MLFAMDAKRTPSVSTTIFDLDTRAVRSGAAAYARLSTSSGPDGLLAAGGQQQVRPSLPTCPATATPARSAPRESPSRPPSPVEGIERKGIPLKGGQIVSMQPQATPSTFSEELWFKRPRRGGMLPRFGSSATGNGGNNDRPVHDEQRPAHFGAWTGVKNIVTSSRPLQRWQLAPTVMTEASDGMNLYVDGAHVASCRPAPSPITVLAARRHRLNAGWPTHPSGAFSGSISDAAMYRSELTPGQIQAQYASSPA